MKLGHVARVARGADWVISRYQEYATNRDKMAEAEAIQKIMTPPRYRGGSWSASGMGTCLRARQLSFLDFPQKAIESRSQNIFSNGDYVHLRHQAFGLVAGYITDTEVPLLDEEQRLKGTMDGVLSNGAVLEIKSIHTRGFSDVNTWGAKREHKLQVTAYMLASGRDSAHLVYEDKNTQAMKEFVLGLEPELVEIVKSELTWLNESTDEKKLLPMLQECKNGEGRWNWCPYAPVCESAKWPKQLTRITSSSDNG